MNFEIIRPLYDVLYYFLALATMETTRTIAAAPSSSSSRHDSTRTKPENAEDSEKNDSVNDDYSKGASSSTTTPSGDCPLFMDGLPSDFAQNSALAAIASLIDDDVSVEDFKDTKKGLQSSRVDFKSGGGKVNKTGKRNNHSPYSKGKGKSKNGEKKSTTPGEVQLFLNMWKI
jgi:hypothetical protein